MEPTKTLRVRARGTALVPDFARADARVRAYIGRSKVEPSPGQFGWEDTGEVVELPNEPPYAAEYIKALRDGDLWAADEATARVCGVVFDETKRTNVPCVVFDPTYGGAIPAAPKAALKQLSSIPVPADAKKED